MREEALKRNFIVCFQNPNYEGILLRMHPGKAKLKPSVRDAKMLLEAAWKDYEKGADAQMLRSKFTLDDLLRVAKVDDELKRLMEIIGIMRV